MTSAAEKKLSRFSHSISTITNFTDCEIYHPQYENKDEWQGADTDDEEGEHKLSEHKGTSSKVLQTTAIYGNKSSILYHYMNNNLEFWLKALFASVFAIHLFLIIPNC